MSTLKCSIIIKLTLCCFLQFGYQENEFLHDVFSFTPKKIGGGKLSNDEKVCFRYLVSLFAVSDLYPIVQCLLTKLDFCDYFVAEVV